ncbi:DUF6456 domain-containing protein [Brevundimonas sp.]|uniref:DUF6456 domain-containing protein n=1 Tax=Brevundimonas sp. TaxID=1871086 RepID=UPI002737BC49|nr:DUF6456 domain-containing protein [Brevundimonas sp.]MDP3802903.1 DUF6456 domain-containing protein [Brevundimonas sp.]
MSGAGESGRGSLTRTRRLLARGGWIEPVANGYAVRAGGDRRGRVLSTLDEADFRRLIAEPGLRVRQGGGWAAARSPVAGRADRPPPGRPGVIDGERTVMQDDGSPVLRRANLGHSAIAWLAHRPGADGRPWLDAAEVAAATRLGLDAEMAARGPSLTLRWDALPRGGGGPAGRVEPGEAALAAAERVRLALAACGAAGPMVEAICIRASALQAAERDLGLRRRDGKRLLKAGLAALTAHYRMG